jgi:hypothetical protein
VRTGREDVEIAVLCHQLMVLRRQAARLRYAPADRIVLAMLAKLLPREVWSVFPVTPATLLRWHRELVARCWSSHRVSALDIDLEPPTSVQRVLSAYLEPYNTADLTAASTWMFRAGTHGDGDHVGSEPVPQPTSTITSSGRGAMSMAARARHRRSRVSATTRS